MMFIKNILRLVSGTILAQLLPLLMLPIITRMMGNEEFGYYTLFFTSTMMLGALVSLRFDYGINSVTTESEAKLMFFLCLYLSIVFSFLILIVVSFLIYFDLLKVVWFLLPFSVLCLSTYQCYYFYINYKQNFRLMSNSKIINAFVCVSVQLFVVVFLHNSNGAYWGLFMGYLFSIIYMYRIEPVNSNKITFKRMRFVFIKYQSYPKLTFPGSLINFISGNIPIYSIGYFYGVSQSGLYGLATRVAGAPTSMIARSISEVFRTKAMCEYKKSGNFRNVFIKVSAASFLLSSVGFVILCKYSEYIFSAVFGNEWIDASKYLNILAPMFILQFTTTAVGYSLMIVNWQKYDFLWQILRLFFVVLVFLFSFVFEVNEMTYIILVSLSLTVSFIFYFYMCYKSTINMVSYE
ncbi:lipopolysaccharide biosynthesis protein [Photobacterium damselae]|uniref:lipopolysaccharide biosynthesis protein n=1 Tax=Photobacterium damselae TaxID=38293 RepID=UPI0015A4E102|nr:oligosaccharide flippase family protein [Photobacterium damselae]NVO60954.1 oligosaccharide flippase family protein [Photobacterium damselae subsp. damselae]